jgi:hypothetical protein
MLFFSSPCPGFGFGTLFLDDTNGNWSIADGVFQDLIAAANNAHIHGPAPAGTAALVGLGIGLLAGARRRARTPA